MVWLRSLYAALVVVVTVYLPLLLQQEQVVRFAVIGDYGVGGAAEQVAVAELIERRDASFIVTTGDNDYGFGYEASVGAVYRGYLPFDFYPAIGNHDWEQVDAYRDYFGRPLYYNVRRGPVEIFFCDSDVRHAGGIDRHAPQALWLQTKLALSTATWKIVVMHRPPYSSGNAHGSNQVLQWPFDEWGADLVLSGHDHLYERIEKDGLTYIVSGLGGAGRYGFRAPIAGSQVRYAGAHGVLIVDTNSHSLTAQFINTSDEVIDMVRLTK